MGNGISHLGAPPALQMKPKIIMEANNNNVSNPSGTVATTSTPASTAAAIGCSASSSATMTRIGSIGRTTIACITPAGTGGLSSAYNGNMGLNTAAALAAAGVELDPVDDNMTTEVIVKIENSPSMSNDEYMEADNQTMSGAGSSLGGGTMDAVVGHHERSHERRALRRRLRVLNNNNNNGPGNDASRRNINNNEESVDDEEDEEDREEEDEEEEDDINDNDADHDDGDDDDDDDHEEEDDDDEDDEGDDEEEDEERHDNGTLRRHEHDGNHNDMDENNELNQYDIKLSSPLEWSLDAVKIEQEEEFEDIISAGQDLNDEDLLTTAAASVKMAVESNEANLSNVTISTNTRRKRTCTTKKQSSSGHLPSIAQIELQTPEQLLEQQQHLHNLQLQPNQALQIKLHSIPATITTITPSSLRQHHQQQQLTATSTATSTAPPLAPLTSTTASTKTTTATTSTKPSRSSTKSSASGSGSGNNNNSNDFQSMLSKDKRYRILVQNQRMRKESLEHSQDMIYNADIEKPWVCRNCHRNYKWKNSLKCHLKNECGQPPRYFCSKLCGYATNVHSNLKRHLNTKCRDRHEETETMSSHASNSGQKHHGSSSTVTRNSRNSSDYNVTANLNQDESSLQAGSTVATTAAATVTSTSTAANNSTTNALADDEKDVAGVDGNIGSASTTSSSSSSSSSYTLMLQKSE